MADPAVGSSGSRVVPVLTALVVVGGSWLILSSTAPGPFRNAELAALAVMLVAWLVVSFSAETPRRAVVEWLGAAGLYGLLVSFFASLVSGAWEEGNRLVLVAFGFLLFLFSGGGLVSLVQMLLSLRGTTQERQSATN